MDVNFKEGVTPEIPRTESEKKEAGLKPKLDLEQRKMKGRDMVTAGIDSIILGYKMYYGRDLKVNVNRWENGMPDKVLVKPDFISFIINKGKRIVRGVLNNLAKKEK